MSAALADYQSVPALIGAHAAARPDAPALIAGDAEKVAPRWQSLSYGALDALMDRVAASLQRDGLKPGDAVALAGLSTPQQAAIFLGALRAGAVVAPIATNVTAESFSAMLRDAAPTHLFADASALTVLAERPSALRLIALDEKLEGQTFDTWLLPPGAEPQPVALPPELPFNIIYSSGTTGTPKGIVQSHGMRFLHVKRGARYSYGPDSVTLLATPLYSNTTLVVFFPTLGYGGSVVLMAKFDASRYLALAQQHRVTHTMLVPVQYQRILAAPEFDRTDLSAFRFKFCTSAPFSAELKAAVLRRWPGGLVEFYGMTEGGGTCILEAHQYPHKLHTVGRPADGHDIRLIDDRGHEVPRGDAGEVVGHSPAMMLGYRNQPALTHAAEWRDAEGKRFIRTGDIGRFDDDGFLTLVDRKKDLIISGGFNIYPSDLEAVLLRHPAVLEAAVIGVPSAQWGETPLAYVVPRADAAPIDADALRLWANAQLGKTQRLSAVRIIDTLPRSPIGKVLKRELRAHASD